MNPIRTFVISSSMLLSVWLAASYATQLEQSPVGIPSPEKTSTSLDNGVPDTHSSEKEKPATPTQLTRLH